MPARRHYPAPACPSCGKQGAGCSLVKDTAYLADDSILRFRQCQFCEHTWWTKQTQEATINSNKYKVIIPDFKELKGRKRVYQIKELA